MRSDSELKQHIDTFRAHEQWILEETRKVIMMRASPKRTRHFWELKLRAAQLIREYARFRKRHQLA